MTLKSLKTFFHTLSSVAVDIMTGGYVPATPPTLKSRARVVRAIIQKFRGFSDDHEAKVGYSGGSFYFIPSAISVTWTG